MTQNEVPEQKTVPFAGFWIRFLADMIDVAVLNMLGFLVGTVGGLVRAYGGVVFLVFLVGEGFLILDASGFL